MQHEYVSFQELRAEYMNNLRKPSCLPACIEEFCGGWSQETYKQIIHKMTKKGSTPLPLYFDGTQSMEPMTNKASAVAEVFKLMDTRKKGRIDACELFSFIILIANAVVEIYGTEKPNNITRNELYYFLDTAFRGVFKLLIKTGEKTPKSPDRRLADEDIKMLVKRLFPEESIEYLMREELAANAKEDNELYLFFSYMITSMQESLKYARDQALQNMKNNLEIKKVMIELLSKVEKSFNQQNKK